MQKRGQVTTFIVLGLLVLLGAGLLFYLTGTRQARLATTSLETQLSFEQLTPEAYVQFCVEQTASKALFYLGFIGGDIQPDPNPFYFRYDDHYMLPYWYYKGKSYLPTKTEAEKNYLSRYVDTKLKSCLDWTNLPQYDITESNVKTTTTIGASDVTFLIDYPVTVSQEGRSRQLEPQYTTTIKLRLNEILTIAKIIIDKEVEDDLYIHWDYLTDVTKRNYNITAYTEADETIVYRILDLQNSLYENKPYIFQWANKIKTVEP